MHSVHRQVNNEIFLRWDRRIYSAPAIHYSRPQTRSRTVMISNGL